MTGQRQPERAGPCLRVALAALVTGATLGGCAAASRGPAMSKAAGAAVTSPGQAQSEIARLERQIANARRALGLAARPARRSRLQLEGDEAPASRRVDQARPPEPPVKTALAPAPAPTAASDGAAAADGEAAPDPCRYTRAICSAADRICSLANYLGERDARERCARAREDCAEARRTTGCDGVK